MPLKPRSIRSKSPHSLRIHRRLPVYVGVSLINEAVYYLLALSLAFAGLHALLVVIFAGIVSILISYCLHSKLTYRLAILPRSFWRYFFLQMICLVLRRSCIIYIFDVRSVVYHLCLIWFGGLSLFCLQSLFLPLIKR